MKFQLSVTMNNAAFEEGSGELTRILHALAEKLPAEPSFRDSGSVLDINGNTVGTWKVTTG